MIATILAVDEKNGIAKNGTIPWRSKEDFAFFKKVTIGAGNNIILMGRKTKESLPKWPLPKRMNITMTSTPHFIDEVSSWDEVVKLQSVCDTLWIIGGANIYNQAFEKKISQKIYISRFNGDYECDQFINMDLISRSYRIDYTTEFNDFVLEVWIVN